MKWKLCPQSKRLYKSTTEILVFCLMLPGPVQLSRYSNCLRARRSGDRISVGARFFVHVQTAPGTHPASCTMGTGFFRGGGGVKGPGRGADHPPHLAPRSRECRSVAYRGGLGGFKTHRNFEVLTELSRIPSSVENTSVTA
jgi:hypothetical protein